MTKLPNSENNMIISVIPHILKLLDLNGTMGVLQGTNCINCNAISIGANRYCPNCTSQNVQTQDLSTKGILTNYTIVRRAAASWDGPVPYILGDVLLPEGVNVSAELIDCAPSKIYEGMKVDLTLRKGGQDKNNNSIIVYKWIPSDN